LENLLEIPKSVNYGLINDKVIKSLNIFHKKPLNLRFTYRNSRDNSSFRTIFFYKIKIPRGMVFECNVIGIWEINNTLYFLECGCKVKLDWLCR